MKRTLLLCAVLLLAAACNRDDEITIDRPLPAIVLDSPTAVYTVKTGRDLHIRPSYVNAGDDATFRWTIGERIVGEEPELLFRSDEPGEVFIRIEVFTPYGRAEEELRVDVAELEIPKVSIPGVQEGLTLLLGSRYLFRPVVDRVSLPTVWRWTVDGTEVSTELDYEFEAAGKGEHAVVFTATTDDGEARVAFTVKVCDKEELPFRWVFEQTRYSLSAGRTIRLMPLDILNAFDARYTWTVDGEEVQSSDDPCYLFTSAVEGEHAVRVAMQNAYGIVTQDLTVEVSGPEGTYRRPKSGASSARWTRVFEFRAAPGQFVNEYYTATTPEEACTYAEGRLAARNYVSLGGFGGYIVVGFDHSIDNTGGYDFAVCGNSFDTSSEPGIVWVMQDENGNGLPDDTWYELSGSEHGREETLRDYAVTYYRPEGPNMSVAWTDNRGNSGTIDYLQQFHRQEYYYPLWVKEPSYTLRGTRLKERNYDQSGNGSYWVQPPYDWGYADNFSPVDRLTDDDNHDAGVNANHFKISNAVDFAGRPAALKYIDFVKVQTGLNTKSGWLGENSTEVFDFYDYSLRKE